jgi:beta-barrel assembly-enhancing protease
MRLTNFRVALIYSFIVAIVIVAYGADNRTKLKPGLNLFSIQQDIEMGRQSARQAEMQLQILNDRQAATYINTLGQNLAMHAPSHEQYPFQFKIVNDTAINAFALPGGFVYVNRGAIEAADNESQIAGVLAHEIGHVVLRHGTNQVTKAYLAQAPLAVLGGALGSGAMGSIIGSLGGLGLNSIFLKYSRTAENQADLMGTQILYDSGYDPKAMVEFFEKIQAESKGRSAQFFSDHPAPENRISSVQHEIEKIGGAPPNARKDDPEFQTTKTLVAGLPAPRGGKGGARTTTTPPRDARGGRPQPPSTRLTMYNRDDLQFKYPDNWHTSGEGNVITVAPDGGVINSSLAYGMMISPFEPDNHGGQISLDEATDQLLNNLQRSNSSMRITRSHETTRVSGQPGLITEASNQSPAGGRETDWIVTTLRPDGTLQYFVGVAPQSEFNDYSLAFEDIVDTVRFK